jgi:hypothetical protein
LGATPMRGFAWNMSGFGDGGNAGIGRGSISQYHCKTTLPGSSLR